MGFADWIRVMRGHLTPEEIAERDARAKARVAAAERVERERQEQQERETQAAVARHKREQERWLLRQERVEVAQQRSAKAAGVGNGTLVCHPDLLAFIQGRLQHHSDWHPPGGHAIIRLDDGLIRVQLSGPQLACIVAHMARIGGATRDFGPFGTDAEGAIARRIYDGIALVVDKTQIAPGGTLPEILIDDRLPTHS